MMDKDFFWDIEFPVFCFMAEVAARPEAKTWSFNEFFGHYAGERWPRQSDHRAEVRAFFVGKSARAATSVGLDTS